MSRPRVLLVITADDARKPHMRGPRKDYRVLGDVLNADTIDRSTVRSSGFLSLLARYAGMATVQAWQAFRQRNQYDVILTDGEHIGIPLALLLKLTRSKVKHVTIGHRLTAFKKKLFFKWLKVH